jgi:hypothetical protein
MAPPLSTYRVQIVEIPPEGRGLFGHTTTPILMNLPVPQADLLPVITAIVALLQQEAS